jgi:hypothetical protein
MLMNPLPFESWQPSAKQKRRDGGNAVNAGSSVTSWQEYAASILP